MEDIYNHMAETPSEGEMDRRAMDMRVTPAFSLAYLRSSADCSLLLSRDGRVTFINDPACDAFGLESLDAAKGRVWWELWPEDLKGALVHAQECVVGGQPVRFSAALGGDGGTWDVLVSPVVNGDGRVETVFVVMFPAD